MEIGLNRSAAPGAVRVDALSIGRLGEPAPRAGGVRQSGDDDCAVDVL